MSIDNDALLTHWGDRPLSLVERIIERTMRHHLGVAVPGSPTVLCLHTPTGGGLQEFDGPVSHRLHVAEQLIADLAAEGVHFITEAQQRAGASVPESVVGYAVVTTRRDDKPMVCWPSVTSLEKAEEEQAYIARTQPYLNPRVAKLVLLPEEGAAHG